MKILIILLLLLLIFCNLMKYKEKFMNESKFYIIQNEYTNYTITNIKDVIISYTSEMAKDFFIKVFKLNNCDVNPMVKFQKINNIKNLQNHQIIVHIDNIIKLKDYKLINYYPKSEYRDRIYYYFPNNEFIIHQHNESEQTSLLLSTLYKPLKIEEKVSEWKSIKIDNDYNFIINRKINGKHYQYGLRDVIILYDKYIDGLEIKMGDKILVIEQEEDFMNGEYIVFKINQNNVKMSRKVDKQLSMYTCVDKELNEYSEYTNKYSCEHDKNMYGDEKKYMSWDSRCVRNNECPFYMRNGDYKGGCINGYCEMPLGVKQISYKKYETDNKCNKPLMKNNKYTFIK